MTIERWDEEVALNDFFLCGSRIFSFQYIFFIDFTFDHSIFQYCSIRVESWRDKNQRKGLMHPGAMEIGFQIQIYVNTLYPFFSSRPRCFYQSKGISCE